MWGGAKALSEPSLALTVYCLVNRGQTSAGKYTPDGPRPAGPRGNIYANKIREIQPLIETMRAVGEPKGKSPAQVALNWLLCKGVVPIPGEGANHLSNDL